MFYSRSIHYRYSAVLMTIIIALAICLGGLATVNANGDAVVNVTTGDSYDDLQEAIDEASSGDVINVYSGAYEGIIISESISLVAPDGPQTASISNTESNPAVRFNGIDVTIKGFNIISNVAIGESQINGPGIEIRDLNENSILIEDCVFEVGASGINFITEASNSNIVIRNNEFNGDNAQRLIVFYGDLTNTSVSITGNSFDTFGTAIHARAIEDGALPIYSGSTLFVVSENEFSNGETAIFIPYLVDGGHAQFINNTIIDCDYGVYVQQIGWRGEQIGQTPEEAPGLIIRGNTMNNSGIEDGIGFSIINTFNGSLTISENVLINVIYWAVYFDDIASADNLNIDILNNSFVGSEVESINFNNIHTDIHAEPGQNLHLNICQNNFASNDIALYFKNIDLYHDASINIRQNKFTDNEYGILIEDALLHHQDSEINLAINLNNFHNNNQAIFLNNRFRMIILEQLDISLNSFIGNLAYAVALPSQLSEGIEEAIAKRNWWGAESGPTVIGLPDAISPYNVAPLNTMGDPVSNNILFDPWLARLLITPTAANKAIGETQTLTMQILDNDGNPVHVDGFSVRYIVSGVNSSSGNINFTGTNAVTSYTSSSIGTDTISAEVYLNGEPTGMIAEISFQWTQANTSTETTGTSTTDTTSTTVSTTSEAATESSSTDASSAVEGLAGIPKTGESPYASSALIFGVVLLAITILIRRKALNAK